MKENKISKAIIYFIGIAVALISLFPLTWMAVAGLKPEAEVLAVPFKFFPSRIDTQNYKVIIEEGLFLRSLGVTLLVAVISSVLALAVNSMSAYVFARLEFPFKKLLWAYEIMTMFIPNIAILISSFIVVSKLGMLDTMAVLILPGLATAYSVFFIRQFYLNIPSSIEEAALIDGANRFQTYLKIFLPLSTTPFVIVGITTYLGYWNSYIWPSMTIMKNQSLSQVMQVIALFRGSYASQQGRIMAASTLAAIPTIALFLVFQKYIIQGIRISGIK
jgi:multiple sugar transport system permease protein